ncbi:terminase small subunit [Aquariibacter albus]|uniref:Terminase small subunit n=1 Tax=Aquariibacter albus TaxID=2759899 RepID=A0A839HIX5_9BURK|nr:terminase small subunit [Aquariibacter albus]MBB1161476.1 terminase small subunit [Aquariibacter albus]
MLTPKQQAFVAEYLVDLNAAAAARRAGYSERVANRIGAENLSKPVIAAAIQEALEARQQRTQIDADWVLKRLAAMADADLADLYGPDGALKPVAEWPEVWRRGLVAGVETEEIREEGVSVGVIRKVKLADRMKSMELIGRHVTVGAWRDSLALTGKGGGPVQTVNMTPDEFRKIAAEMAGKV